MSNRIRRSFVSLSIAVLCAGFVFIGGSGRALANPDCLQSNPEARVSIRITTLTSSQLTALVHNDGPCNVPDAVVMFTFPAGTTVGTVTTSPNSWNCGVVTGVTSTVVICPQGGGAPTLGVPGNHDFSVPFSGGTGQTIVAQVTVGGGPAACGDGDSSTTCDKNPDDNTIWALVTTPGEPASLKTCPSAPTNPCKQYVELSAINGSGDSVQVTQLDSLCPPDSQFPNSFGKCVSIAGNANALGTVTTLILTIDASLAHGAYGGVNLINISSTPGSQWEIVPNCTKSESEHPCVFLKTKFKVVDPTTSITTTFIQFWIHKIDDDGWGFDG